MHTKGKWEVTGKTKCIKQINIGIKTEYGIDPICCVYGTGIEAEANARLIALAPELLSVIKDCLSYADAQAVLKQGEAVELRGKCRVVIKKVEDCNNGNT